MKQIKSILLLLALVLLPLQVSAIVTAFSPLASATPSRSSNQHNSATISQPNARNCSTTTNYPTATSK